MESYIRCLAKVLYIHRQCTVYIVLCACTHTKHVWCRVRERKLRNLKWYNLAKCAPQISFQGQTKAERKKREANQSISAVHEIEASTFVESVFWLHTNASRANIYLHFGKVKANFAELYNTFTSCQLIKFRKWLGLFSLPPRPFLSHVLSLYSIIIYIVKCVSASFYLHGCGMLRVWCAAAICAHIFSILHLRFKVAYFCSFLIERILKVLKHLVSYLFLSTPYNL